MSKPMGRTGQRVPESGTYRCGRGTTWSYVQGDTFLPCPETGAPTVWEKTEETPEPDHPQH